MKHRHSVMLLLITSFFCNPTQTENDLGITLITHEQKANSTCINAVGTYEDKTFLATLTIKNDEKSATYHYANSTIAQYSNLFITAVSNHQSTKHNEKARYCLYKKYLEIEESLNNGFCCSIQ